MIPPYVLRMNFFAAEPDFNLSGNCARDIVDSHQFGAYTDCFGIGPACLHKR